MLIRQVSKGSLRRLLFDFVSASFQVVIMSHIIQNPVIQNMPYGSCPVGQMIRTIL